MNFLLILVAIAVSPWLLRLFLWGCRGGRLVEGLDPLPAKAAPQKKDTSRNYRIVWNTDSYRIERLAWPALCGWWYRRTWDGDVFSEYAYSAKEYRDYASAEKDCRLIRERTEHGAQQQAIRRSKHFHTVTSEQRPQKEDEQ